MSDTAPRGEEATLSPEGAQLSAQQAATQAEVRQVCDALATASTSSLAGRLPGRAREQVAYLRMILRTAEQVSRRLRRRLVPTSRPD